MGAASYFQDFLGGTVFTEGNIYGLPMGYWSVLGGVIVRRVGSVYLSSQGFAIPFLLLMPAATVWVFGRDRKLSIPSIISYALIWVGFLLSLTRMTIVICVLQLMLYAIMNRKAIWAVSGLAIFGAVFLAISAAFPRLLGFVFQTFTWQTESSQSHLRDWWSGAVAFFERPWGSGPGTTDAIPVRFGLKPLTADNQYLKYAVELGLVGLILHLAVFAAILGAAWHLFKNGDRTTRSFGIVLLLATLGILVNAWTAVVFNSTVLAYIYFWLAGAAITERQRIERGERAA
jgi:O-antigen ligase